MMHYYLIIGLNSIIISSADVWRNVLRRYSIPCPVMVSGVLHSLFSRSMRSRTKKTINELNLIPGMKVLDAGCGMGRLTLPIADAVGTPGEVTAIDIHEERLRIAEKKARDAHLTNIRFIRSDLGEGRLKRNFFDRAVLVTVLGEIPNRKAAFQELYYSLKPEGILLVEETILDTHFQTRSTVIGLAIEAGFVEKEFLVTLFSYTLVLQKPSDAL
jgi:ubiquinone/menaquinone biosynthesis C-methylase UbiE